MPWDDNLVGQAREIAASNARILRVIAGPGTGKTFALMRRVARLLEQGQDPARILLVTFTRVSAGDLKRELNLLGLPGVDGVAKGTLHALCFSILNRRHVLDFTQRTPRPLLHFEERFLSEDLSLDGEFGIYYERRSRLKAFEAAWAREQDQDPGWPHDPVDRSFQLVLEEWLRFHNAMLLAELVPLSLRYLRTNPGCQELTQFDHILVDEYQDLNRAEQSLIDLLSHNGNLTVVGDEDQAIYEDFRYAHPESISEFHRTHDNTTDLPLDVSRRCPPRIVALANALIQHNLRRSGRQLLPSPVDHSPEVYIVQWPDMESEAEGLADFIASRIQSGQFDPGQTLVLCPRRQFGYLIRDQLRQRGIDAHSFFHEEALDGNPKVQGDSLAQQAFTLLSILAHPEDRVALRCWLGFGSRSLRSGEYDRLRVYCAQQGTSTWYALAQIRDGQIAIPHTTGLIERFDLLAQELQQLATLSPDEVFDHLFPVGQEWAEPFRAIYDQAGEPLSLDQTLDLLRTSIVQPELPSYASYVRIMSLHKSKGLNAHHVIVTGCLEGLVPSHKPMDNFEAERRYVEEQRRLFYVAVTRAKRTLVLSSTLTLPRDLAHRIGAPVRGGDSNYGETIASTFISELGLEAPDSIYGPGWAPY